MEYLLLLGIFLLGMIIGAFVWQQIVKWVLKRQMKEAMKIFGSEGQAGDPMALLEAVAKNMGKHSAT
jgi:hypothetical protein